MTWIEPTAERYERCCKITDEIDRKLETIEADTAHRSTLRHTLEHPEFKALEAMGDRIVPYLFHLITSRGADWAILSLLGRLVAESPVKHEHRGKFYHIIHDWLGWYLTSEHYERDDIYHGLVD